jgi:hypothetical protein
MHVAGAKRSPRARTLSLYYFILEDFDALAGHPGHQAHLTSGFSDPDLFVRLAQRSQQAYRHSVRWGAVKQNLQINRLLTARELAHLEVHYTFLSAFVHPASALVAEVYGGTRWGNSRGYDHYAAELCLLYVLEIAAAELEALNRMSKRAPRVRIRDRAGIESDIAASRRLSAHLWFPPKGRPHLFDRIEEANSRFAVSMREGKPRVVDPTSILERGIRYYRDPLRRIIRMHSSFTELTTGLSFRSPWERADAWRRG